MWGVVVNDRPEDNFVNTVAAALFKRSINPGKRHRLAPGPYHHTGNSTAPMVAQKEAAGEGYQNNRWAQQHDEAAWRNAKDKQLECLRQELNGALIRIAQLEERQKEREGERSQAWTQGRGTKRMWGAL